MWSINPVVNTVASDSVIQLGNKNALNVDELKMRMAVMGIDEKTLTREKAEYFVNQIAQEILLVRAANRENLKQDPEIIANLKKIEEQFLMSAYLQKYILKDCKENDKDKRMELLAEAINNLKVKEELKINTEVLEKSFSFVKSEPAQQTEKTEK